MEQRLKLPVGIEFFDEIRTSGYYYIDKTKLIRTGEKSACSHARAVSGKH